MQRFRWIALQGSSRGFLTPLLLIYFITTSGIPAHAADDPTACRTPVARIVSIQGSIEVLRAPQNDWVKVTRLDIPLCEGDRLRTGELSRAALFIQPETLVRVDQNTNISVSQTAEETLVEFRQEEVRPAAASAYTCGAGYFITRFPRKFRVRTPHLNAAVEGTEFLVAMRCEGTELSVFEGKVLAAGAGANIFPAQTISSGQILTIGGSEPPAVKLLVKPAHAVQWVVYYPPLSDATAEADLPPAEQCRSLPKPLDQTCLTQRAEALLRLGRVDEAQREVDEAVALDPGRGDANALRAIVNIARNDKVGAIEAATAATTASPSSSRAWLALSYAQQASFKLEDSLSSARNAQSLEPNSSATNARVAELLMSLGRIKDAEIAARAAVDANPTESRARTVLGFVHLAQIKTKAARADFEAAIKRDSSDPLPRLGLGLAIIRDGKLADGREQLEIAVALDPTNSLLRSYVGKAYFEENRKERDQLAAGQFDLAKKLDPNDPTPWFYEAILKQTENRPVEALGEIDASIRRNDNRAPYRSRLMLDQDIAARSASLGRIFSDLTFDELALREGSKSLQADPANYSAHRLLADSYGARPRHQIARVSELLQSQLWQPFNVSPPSPQGAATDLFIVSGPGPSGASFNEFTSLFAGDGLGLQSNISEASNRTHSGDLTIQGLSGPLSFSAGVFHYQTDGFRNNNDQTIDIANVFVQATPSYSTSFQAEIRSERSNQGDLALRFDRDLVLSSLRENTDIDTTRVGFRHSFSAESHLIASAVKQHSEFNQNVDPFVGATLSNHLDGDDEVAEIQHVLERRSFRLISGVGHLVSHGLSESTLTLVFPPVSVPFAPIEERINHTNAYVYSQWSYRSNITWHVGIGADWVDRKTDHLFQLNPKLGLIWEPSKNTSVRLGAFRNLSRQLVNNQTIEPTQVAGFNQFFDDPGLTESKRYGVGIDQRFSTTLYAGAEYTARDSTVPFIFASSGTGGEARTNEGTGMLYLYWALRPFLAVRAQYEYESLERDRDIVPQGFGYLDLTTQRLPITVNWFLPAGLTASVSGTAITQRGTFFDTTTSMESRGKDTFWLLDANLKYRFPRRFGAVIIGARNLLDEEFSFHEPDPANPTVHPDAFFYLRVQLVL